MPDAFAVFEGGGVKGIGHVGALAEIGWREPSLTFRGYAGASAGAIVAALAAAGYQAAGDAPDAPAGDDSMKSILEQMDFTQLLDGLDDTPLTTIQRMESAFAQTGGDLLADSRRLASSKTWNGMKLTRWNALGLKLTKVAKENADILQAFKQLWQHKGVYGTTRFRTWIDNLLKRKNNLLDPNGNVTFKSLQRGTNGTVLKVVVTDVAGRVPKTYGPDITPSDHIADAVVASMTIPLFFRPFPYGPNNYYVDGGFLSNFPAWLFDEENNMIEASGASKLPILGIRLVPPRHSEPPNITSTGRYLGGLWAAKFEGGDFLQTRLIERFVGINVELPPGLKAVDFNLDAKTKKSLFDRGTFAAEAALLVPNNRAALGL